MAKITVDQITKINNMCSNEWMLDVDFFLFHNEKTLIKRIKLGEDDYLSFRLRYNSENQIYLHIAKVYHKPNTIYEVTSRCW